MHPEVKAKYYGCGLCLPDDDLAGLSVLDLGCGAGRDCYLLSQLVGESGRVVGVDMTEAQLAVAREHQEWHAQEFGFASPNTEFKEGVIDAHPRTPTTHPRTPSTHHPTPSPRNSFSPNRG